MPIDYGSIFINLVSDWIGWVTGAALLLISTQAPKLIIRLKLSISMQILAAFFVSHIAIFSWLFWEAKIQLSIQLFFVSVLTIAGAAGFIYWVMRGLRAAQITAAFPTIEAGIGYSDSLKRVHKSLDFMGIGAHKLTSEKEFEKAIGRCTDLTATGVTVRLLLASPSHPIIGKTARKNEVVVEDYERNVDDSLKTIARIAEKRPGVIQVKHYSNDMVKDYPQFRLMFIDDALCLFSWNVWDSSKGRNNPQLVLRSGNSKEKDQALYKANRKYFDDLWEMATVFDLNAAPK